MGLDVRYSIWYPFFAMLVNSLQIPPCVQSFPSLGNTYPRMSLFVIVPSTSLITILLLFYNRYSLPNMTCVP